MDAASIARSTEFDVIICGAGTSGSVIARRLTDNRDIKVLLLESGGTTYSPAITEAVRWPENIAADHDWKFHAEPEPGLGGRSLLMSMGRVVGGSSSINAMIWARGHKADWDHYADEAGDPAWNYSNILKIYQRIEDYRGKADTVRGTEGPVKVFQPAHPHPVAPALVDAARSVGIPSFTTPNGLMMEEKNGASISDVRAEGEKRITIYDAYLRPVEDRANLTLLTNADVHRVVVHGGRAVGVDVFVEGRLHRFRAAEHVVLSAGAINTPRILLQSGIGNSVDLKRLGIAVVNHLPGVGENLQDHICFPSIFKFKSEMPARGNGSEATIYATLGSKSMSPDVVMCQGEFPICSPELAQAHEIPANAWSLVAGLARPLSRGRVKLRAADPSSDVLLQLNTLSHPDDLDLAKQIVKLSREIGEQPSLRATTERQILPGDNYRDDLDTFVKLSGVPFWHQTCTAKMGRDEMSVVDSKLKVHGIENLTVADGSVFPRIPTGNTMAPCVVVGERAADILQQDLLRYTLRPAEAEFRY
ncbi:GMC family oxidoreductase [Rhizobium leguminosarum]|uniref:GMC family oxidoreductase n=1 Tax=Rhizobium leguminosarum TaxID=384 RepID=A0A444I7V1_RHILE|nr:GMC family oxidoreductase N-terminal domain-containing protein [Rhizobium leguminosarum]RWX34203.1 GMC family oxidoreductase [Rhizobium leguminosarum]